MGVKDKLISGKALSVIRSLDQTSREFKSYQTRASASVVNYRITSGNPYDILVPGDYSTNIYEIEFIPSNMQFGGAFCYRLFNEWVGGGTYPAGTNTVYNLIVSRQFVGTDRRQKWLLLGVAGAPTKYRLHFFASGTGTFTVKKL